ncbi:hypothetical protein ACFSUD_02675 [Sulfitobacter aestuarii]|uniref:Uncharacterized protein n=1 Tax=Sulfitobacter aestuarii TaxID=2161676 RepID=A0ABW5TXV7_9RHOB
MTDAPLLLGTAHGGFRLANAAALKECAPNPRLPGHAARHRARGVGRTRRMAARRPILHEGKAS